MSANDIPKWARARACELVRAENDDANVEADDYLPAFGRALARYIAAHEEAPADPVAVLSEIIRKRYKWHATGPGIVSELAEHGIRLVKDDAP